MLKMMTTTFFFSLLLTSHANAALDCNLAQRIGNGSADLIMRKIDSKIAGQKKRINRRKTLIIRGMDSLSFKGCKLHAKMKVKLKRKIRRDAIGKISFTAKVYSFNARQVCLKDIKVTKVRLSRTLRLGESVYKWVANKTLANRQCFSI